MTIEEIQAENAKADLERVAQAEAEKVEVKEVEPPKLTPEEEEAQKAAEAFKARQNAVVEAVRGLVETLVNDSNEFTVDELGWATDAFKNLLTIRTTATEQHERLSKVLSDAQAEYYSTKAKDLIVVSHEVSPTTTEAVAS